MHTVTIHDNETGCQRIHYTDNGVAAHAFARKMHRHYGAKVTVTDPSDNTVLIRENGWSRA